MHAGPQCGCCTHLGLWGATFISDQQQIALSVSDNLFLEPATCHTHTHTKHLYFWERQSVGRRTGVSFACGKIRLDCGPGGSPECLGVASRSVSSNHWALEGLLPLQIQ